MPDITRDQVAHLAALARIDVSEAELAHLTDQLQQIVGAVEKVNEVASADVPATSHPLPLTNVMRADIVTASLTADAALSDAPEREGDYFKVPTILGEE